MKERPKLPKGWKIRKINKIGNLFSGNSINAKIKEEKYMNIQGGIPYIATKDVGFDRSIDYENGVRIPESDLSKFRVATKNTILICAEGGSAGRKIGITNQDVCLVNKLFTLSVNIDVQPYYVFYYYQSERFQTEFKSNLTGLIGGVSKSKFKNIQIPIPPLPEQKQIVEILDKAFEAIDKAKANIERNIVNANELFQSKLNEIFSQKGEGWEETTLKKVCEITSKLVNPEESKYIDLIHVGGGNIEAETGKLINLKTAREEELKSGKFKFNSTMVLYNKIRPYLVKVTRPEFNGLCSADMYPLVPIKDEITRDFLYYLLISKNFTDYAISGSSRAGMPKVNRKHLFDYQFSIASLEKQKKLTKELELLRTEYMSITSFYNQKLASLEELKKSILEKAFSGELTS
ncbi:restriction endonuclease subunit S [Brumimicrobium mesophilum]|uniref:restriction endonuclease subunit S n=1 Tax=Brumimicrobium mesophilum TaxID=392717 RepID=UPI00131CA1ED|nr:restriction endonuclease subunit S [Brumimicrobium mesophilum]